MSSHAPENELRFFSLALDLRLEDRERDGPHICVYREESQDFPSRREGTRGEGVR